MDGGGGKRDATRESKKFGDKGFYEFIGLNNGRRREETHRSRR